MDLTTAAQYSCSFLFSTVCPGSPRTQFTSTTSSLLHSILGRKNEAAIFPRRRLQ
jgi:hypothetical protein